MPLHLSRLWKSTALGLVKPSIGTSLVSFFPSTPKIIPAGSSKVSSKLKASRKMPFISVPPCSFQKLHPKTSLSSLTSLKPNSWVGEANVCPRQVGRRSSIQWLNPFQTTPNTRAPMSDTDTWACHAGWGCGWIRDQMFGRRYLFCG